MSCGCSDLFKIPSDQSGRRVSPEAAVSDTFCRATRHCMNEPIQPVGSGITGGPAWGCSSGCLCPLLPLWSPSSTSTEHRDACSYAGFDRASGSRSCLQQAVAAGANVGPEPSLYLPSTSPSGLLVRRRQRAHPLRARAFHWPRWDPTLSFLTPGWAAGAEQGRIIATSSQRHSAKFPNYNYPQQPWF